MVGKISLKAVFTVLLVSLLGGTSAAQTVPQSTTPGQAVPVTAHPLNGVYRIDRASSDQFYSTVENVSSKLGARQRQRIFVDLAVRLSPPDLLAIECRGQHVTVGSSRAAEPITYVADGVTRVESAKDGHAIHSRIELDGNRLAFTSTGRPEDNLSFTFTLIDNGARLQVVRQLFVNQLNQPVDIKTIYNKIESTVRWTDYRQTQIAKQATNPATEQTTKPAPEQLNKPITEQPIKLLPEPVTRNTANSNTAATAPPKTTVINVANNNVALLRQSLKEWLAATNQRDVEKQMTFYAPELQAFYLTRNASRKLVHNEKMRIFSTAQSVNITTGEPEVIFQNDGRTAIMRFLKQYRIDYKSYIRTGEVIQELKWQQTTNGWKIISERDVKVIR